MNYSSLSTKELLHYASLDAMTELERALVAKLEEMQTIEADYKDLEDEHGEKMRKIERRIDGIMDAIRELEEVL